MSSLDPRKPRSAYWRNLAEVDQTAEFQASLGVEFPAGTDPGRRNRRRWLQLMGASIGLAGAAGCRMPREELLPFAQRPEGRTPGEPQRYATAMDLAGAALGLVVTTIDGRPVKVEGNPEHPQSRGATDGFAQAAVLELYDPDRSRQVIEQSGGQTIRHTSWDKFQQFAGTHFAAIRQKRGAGLRVLSEALGSPTLAALRQRLLEAMPEAGWHEYEPLSQDNEIAGTKLLFGRPYRPQYDLTKADDIVCLDADLLGSHPASVRYARDYADRREVMDGKMNRLYAVESCYSVTGAAADHRLPMQSREIAAFAEALRSELELVQGEAVGNSPLTPAPPPTRGEGGSEAPSRVTRFLRAVAKDLKQHQGTSLIVAGPCQPAELHALVHRLNCDLGNSGKTVRYTAEPERPTHIESIQALANEIRSGKVDTLVILGGNPVYNAPVDVEFAAALAKVPTTIHLGLYRHETALRCVWHLPQAHFLESWGDARAWDGTYSVVQPMIEPLYGGRSAPEVVALLLGEKPASAYDMVRQTFRQIAGQKDFDQRWRKTVHDGLLAGSQWSTETPQPGEIAAGPSKQPSEEWKRGELELVFLRDPSVHDGRFANNGWLQEAPDPMTRLTWDNALLIGPGTAKALDIANDTVVHVGCEGRPAVRIPAYVMPGMAAGTVAVALGYGRTAAGHVGGSQSDGVEPVGVDVYALRETKAMHFRNGVTVIPTGRPYRLACVQDHHAVDTVGLEARAERLGALVRETTLQRYNDKEHPYSAEETVHHPPLKSLWDEHSYAGHRWGMSIDLSKCIGCNACVVACQAENNIPVVGKERVLEGREMHWIRVDRYFTGDDIENPPVTHQVVLCQQCENAPCEQVCPVAATVHSKEGLNDMVYNRCVGTRYCANNCPYKVRRFNYFYYHWDLEKPENQVQKMVYNPEVTIRSRGVMEKCTYCVQRIQAVKIDAKNHQRAVVDGQIKTACQQACPAQAIEFGDLGDQASRVAQLHASNRSYGMLAELNVKPRTRYLARVRNLNPELTDSRDEHNGHTA